MVKISKCHASFVDREGGVVVVWFGMLSCRLLTRYARSLIIFKVSVALNELHFAFIQFYGIIWPKSRDSISSFIPWRLK